jgi:hypothetical protein
MNFSGDTDTFRMGLWASNTTNNMNGYLVADRAVTASGTYSDDFFYIAHTLANTSGVSGARSAARLNSALGSLEVSLSTLGFAGVVSSCGTASTTNFGAVTPYSIFPIIGFLANPLLGVMAYQRTDVASGGIFPVWLYGASHNYLVYLALSTAASPNTITSSQYPAMRWE